MRNYTFLEILLSLLYSSGIGCVLGMLLSVLTVLMMSAKAILLLPARAYRRAGKNPFKDLKWFAIEKSDMGAFLGFFRDFIFVLVYGLSFYLLLYVASDGVPRLYLLFTAVLFTYLTSKTAGRLFNKLSLLLISRIYTAAFLILSIAFIPVGWVVLQIRKLLFVLQLLISSMHLNRKGEKIREKHKRIKDKEFEQISNVKTYKFTKTGENSICLVKK